MDAIISPSVVHAAGGDAGDHRAVPAGGRLHRAGGAQGAGRFPGAPGPHARGPARPAAAHRRRAEAAAQGRHHPHRMPTRPSSGSRPCISTFTGADRLRRAAVRQQHLRGRRQRGPAGDFGHVGGGNSGHHSGRLGVQQPLSAAGRAAQRGATGELRSGAVVRAAFRRDGGRHAQHAGHRPGAGRRAASGSSSTTTAS